VLRITKRIFLVCANAIAFAKSEESVALTEYVTLAPGSQGSSRDVKGSQLSLATAAAMTEDEETSLKTTCEYSRFGGHVN
jgi:hypothetical protein